MLLDPSLNRMGGGGGRIVGFELIPFRITRMHA